MYGYIALFSFTLSFGCYWENFVAVACRLELSYWGHFPFSSIVVN